MKKILFIAPINTKDRFKGGITSYAETIVGNNDIFVKSNITFIPLNNCLVNRKPGSNGKISFLNFLNFIKTRRLIAKTLRKDNFDAIYLNTSFGISLLKDLLTLKKSYKKKYKVFLHIHFAGFDNIFTKKTIVKKMIKKNLKKKVTKIISLSKEFKEELISNGFKEGTISVLYNYFDPSLQTITEEDLKNKYFNKTRKPVFLFVGSLDKRKGFYDLIEAFSQLDAKKANLIICGKPNDKESEKLLEHIKGKKAFEYRGYVSGDSKNKAFLDSDVLVLPSYGEGLPITILEAFHFGIPVISTCVGAIPEIINETNGFIINPGDIDALKNTINKLCDKQLLLKMSLSCLEESKKFTFKTFSSKLIEIVSK